MLMRRAWVLHLLMFAISYAAFLAYFSYTKPGPAVASTAMNFQQAVAAVGSELITPAIQLPTQVAQPSKQVASVPSASHANAYARLEAATIPPEDTFVPDYSSPQAHVTSLERAAQFDEHAANRLSAISSLRQQAAIGDTDGSIAEAVRAATMDDDADVRNAAQSAYNEIMASKQER